MENGSNWGECLEEKVVVGAVGLLMETDRLCPVSEWDLDLLVAELCRKGGMKSAWSDRLRLCTMPGSNSSGDKLDEGSRGDWGQQT